MSLHQRIDPDDVSGASALAELRQALDERKAKLALCPVRSSFTSPAKCPKCGATSRGPCWVNVEADAAFVDAVKEVLAKQPEPQP